METLPTILLQDMTDRVLPFLPNMLESDVPAEGWRWSQSHGEVDVAPASRGLHGCWLLLRLQLGFPIIVPAGHGDAGEAKR